MLSLRIKKRVVKGSLYERRPLHPEAVPGGIRLVLFQREVQKVLTQWFEIYHTVSRLRTPHAPPPPPLLRGRTIKGDYYT